MSDSVIATQPLPPTTKLTEDESIEQNNGNSPADIKAKSPTPSDENSTLPPQIVESKPDDEEGCLIIEDDEPPQIEKIVDNNDNAARQNSDIPAIGASVEKLEKVEELPTEVDTKLSIDEKPATETSNVKINEEKPVEKKKEEPEVIVEEEVEKPSTSKVESLTEKSEQVVTTTAPTLTTNSSTTASPAQSSTLVSDALTTNVPKKAPRKRRPNQNSEAKKQEMNQHQTPIVGQLTPQNGFALQMGPNGPQLIALQPNSKLPPSISMQSSVVSTSGSPFQLQYRPNITQTANGQFIFYNGAPPAQLGQQLTPPTTATNTKPGQRKGAKEKESAVSQKTVSATTATPMMLTQGNCRFQVAPGQAPNGQNIQQFLQAGPPGIIMKQISVTSGAQPIPPKAGQSATASSAPLTQPQFTTAPANVLYAMRGGTAPISIRPIGPQPGPIMINNQLMNLVPVNIPHNVQYHVAPGATLGLQEMHPPPPTLSPNLAPPASKSPKPSSNSNNKKKKSGAGSSTNGTSTNGMFANAATKFMSSFNVNSPNLSLKAAKLNAPIDERPEADSDPTDDEPPPKIEFEGAIGTDSNNRLSQQQQAHNTFIQAARIQQSRLATQPQLKKHFVDGRVVEEELPPHKSQINSTPTKQRKIGQPPSLPVKERPATVLNNLKSTLNRVQTVQTKVPPVTRPISSNFQPPPIVKPASYNPPIKDSPQKTSTPISIQQIKKELKNSPIKAAQIQQRASDPPKPSTSMLTTNGQSSATKLGDSQRKTRGRPPKTHYEPVSDSSFNRSRESVDRPKQRKNREVENLINMDFGPGKTPFATTSADLYTENVLTSRERIQSHVSSGYDGRHSRASVSSTNSRQQTLNTRRSTHRQTSSSNLSPPATKRPRRDAQRNASYKNSALFDEEDDEMDIDEERPTIETPVNTCLYCKKPARDPKLPQYCNEECKRKFKKRQRLERLTNKSLNTSSASTASFKSEPGTSNTTPGNIAGQRHSLDSFASPSLTIKLQSPTAGPETIFCDGSGAGLFKISSPTSNGNLNDSSARELDKLKARGVQNWATDDVARWVELVCGSVEIAAKFVEQEIDGDALLMLEENQLKQDLGLKLGPYMKLMKDLKKIKGLE